MKQSTDITARRCAYKILCHVIIKGKSIEESKTLLAPLSPQDIKFARALIFITLRYFGALEHLLRANSTTGKKIKPKELSILAAMGAAQMQFMDVPAHASVDTTLKLAAKEGFVRQKGFLNAILRKIAKLPQKSVTTDAKTTHFPAWMLQSWAHAYGKETITPLLQSLATEAPLDITCPDAKKRQELIHIYQDNITQIGHHSLRFTGKRPDVSDIHGHNEGYWWVQDAASAYPISALTAYAPLKDTWKTLEILDLCAAPGGKTMQLATMGAHVTALDISKKRLDRLRDNIKRTHLEERVRIVQGDALTHHGTYDIIVLDAPCTATGTMRRHPDAAFTKTKEQMDELTSLQTQMLAHTDTLLKPKGYILYCTCSLQPEEGENIINQYIDAHTSFYTLNIFTDKKLAKHQTEPTDKKDFFRSLPHKTPLNSDGFFSALLQKK